MIRKTLLVVGALLAVLAAAVAANTVRHGSRQIAVAAVPPLALDENAAAARLAGAVRLRTISYDEQPDASADELLRLHAYLAQHYPHAHAALRRETVNGYSLLYTWPGSDPAARPIMLMAHQDVVPIAPGSERDWSVPPFAGEIRDGFVWGRGAWDDKGNLCAIMEAVDMLAARGFRPRQTVYLAFGHDEEAGGPRGARAIAALLRSRGVKLDFVVDEGLLITQGVLKGIDKPVALIGTAEKGYLNLTLSVSGTPGHSSMPAAHGVIGTLAAGLARLEDRPMPAAIRGVAREMFDTLAPEMNGINRVLLSNLWLFGPLVRSRLEKSPATNAMLRTTTALTVVRAGEKENILPGRADAVVNFRLLPGDASDDAVAHARAALADDHIRLERRGPASEASPVSPTDAPSYRVVARTVREIFPAAVVAPGLMIGGTDARHMAPLAAHIYRFSPVRAGSEDLARFHGTDERISLANFAEMIHFYHRLLTNAAGDQAHGGRP